MDKPKTAPAFADATPARRWRNWYRSIVDHETGHAGLKRAGDEFPGKETYLSEEDAEAAALVGMELREMAREIGGDADEGDPTIYLGARPNA